MDKFPAEIKNIEQNINKYVALTFPNMAAKKTLRFIDDNFRNQSWAGLPNLAWHRRKGNKDSGRGLLIKTATLRRSFLAQTTPGAARIYTPIVYAKAHNEGSRETVSIPAHTRRKLRKAKVQMLHEFTKSGKHKTKTIQIHEGDINVSAHTRQLNIKRRQFMPSAERPSTVLTDSIKREVHIAMYKILKGKFL